MLSYTFRMLSQQFGASFIFIESYCTFLFKVYIKPNRISDTLLTSKMELFATISFCKVIFCRFKILYKQHCPVSVFFVSARYWFQFVPRDFTWKHLRWCFLRQQLLLMLYSNGQFYCTHSFFLRVSCFLCQSLLSLSRSRWFYLVPDGSSLFQVVPACSSQFQVFSTHLKLFLVLACTLQDTCAAFLLFLQVEIMRSHDCPSMSVYTN